MFTYDHIHEHLHVQYINMIVDMEVFIENKHRHGHVPSYVDNVNSS
jgi:hypothetical protein